MKFLKIKKIFIGLGDYFFLFDIKPLKYNFQIGLDTLVVYTFNLWMLDFISKLTRKTSRLESTAAKVKLKKIGGSLYKRWSVWFNSIIHVKSYQCSLKEN